MAKIQDIIRPAINIRDLCQTQQVPLTSYNVNHIVRCQGYLLFTSYINTIQEKLNFLLYKYSYLKTIAPLDGSLTIIDINLLNYNKNNC